MVPVLIGTYTRVDHLRETIDALKSNYLSEFTDIYIASDCQIDSRDADAVWRIREYINGINGFASVNKIFRERNLGPRENFNEAAYQIFDKSNEIIIMEDDIVTGMGFLKFMNDSLRVYKDDANVVSVSGYLWPEFRFQGDEAVLLPAYAPWGWGTWRDRHDEGESILGITKSILNEPSLLKDIAFSNPSILPMLNAASNAGKFSFDLDWYLNIVRNRKFTVFPPCSLVKNIGFDGSGMNCGLSDKYINQEIISDRCVSVVVNSKVDFNCQKSVMFNQVGGWKVLVQSVLMVAASYAPLFVINLYKKIRAIAMKMGQSWG